MSGVGQLDTLDANKSRFVTKCRWAIEQVFGRLETKFRLFSVAAQNSTLAYDFDNVLIGLALLNLFHTPILSDKRYAEIANITKARLKTPNRFKDVVYHFNLTQVRTAYVDIKYTALDNTENNEKLGFSKLLIDDL